MLRKDFEDYSRLSRLKIRERLIASGEFFRLTACGNNDQIATC